jgi:Flp pilus assembly protein TadG
VTEDPLRSDTGSRLSSGCCLSWIAACFTPAPRGRRGEHGQALVEFALILPVLMLIVVGIIKGATLYNNYTQLTNAVDAGARAFSVERGQVAPCTDAATEVANAAGSLRLSSITISMSVNHSPPPYQVTADDPSSRLATGAGTCPVLISGDPATLSATYPCDLKILSIDFAPGCTLSASATESAQ